MAHMKGNMAHMKGNMAHMKGNMAHIKGSMALTKGNIWRCAMLEMARYTAIIRHYKRMLCD